MFRPWDDINQTNENEGENLNSLDFVDCDMYSDVLHGNLEDCNYKKEFDDNIDAAKNNDIDTERKYKSAELRDVMQFLINNNYPPYIQKRNDKSNFRKQCKPYAIEDGILIYKKTKARVVFDNTEKIKIIKMIHCGSNESEESSALSSHRGRDTTQRLIKKRFYWLHMAEDVRTFIQECAACQKVNPATLKVVPEMQSIEVPKQVFRQIGVDLMTLPEVDGYKYVIVAIDYFSKWSEARPLYDKTAVSVARFLYDDVICRHGCPRIQINDQGREFLNSLNIELSRLTGTKQRVTSAYHPQANGLVERQNRTIKNCLLKVLQDNVNKWPSILQGVLFAHRTAQHSSTGYSPFKMLYQREAILPIDLDDSIEKGKEEDKCKTEDPFNKDDFDKTLNQMINMRNVMENHAHKNIGEAQKRQRLSYSKRHNTGQIFKKNDKVLVRNLKRDDRKGGWKYVPWEGPYTIVSINNGNTVTLKSKNKTLAKTQHLSNLKHFKESDNMKEVDLKNNLEGQILEENMNTEVNEDKDDTEKQENSQMVLNNDTVSLSGMNKSRVFNPIAKPWQILKCEQLKLNLTEVLKFKGRGKFLSEPAETKNILGDGNCLYRALSYWITGTEENHKEIRKHIAEVVKTNTNIHKYVGKEDEIYIYLEKNKIYNDGVWGTDVEIFAATQLLKTSIYVYTTATNTWQLFNKNFSLKKKYLSYRKMYIYKKYR